MRMIKGVVGGEVKNSPRRAKPRLSNPAPATKEWSIVASKRAAIFLWLEGYEDDRRSRWWRGEKLTKASKASPFESSPRYQNNQESLL
jgi:hypothetical protein